MAAAWCTPHYLLPKNVNQHLDSDERRADRHTRDQRWKELSEAQKCYVRAVKGAESDRLHGMSLGWRYLSEFGVPMPPGMGPKQALAAAAGSLVSSALVPPKPRRCGYADDVSRFLHGPRMYLGEWVGTPIVSGGCNASALSRGAKPEAFRKAHAAFICSRERFRKDARR